MKRKRGTLTGGTGDVSPQWLTSSCAIAGGNSIETAIQLPVTRIPQSGFATIIEVLRIYVDWRDSSATLAAGERLETATLTLGTKSFGTTANAGLAEPTVFALSRITSKGAFTAAGTYYQQWNPIEVFDLEDGAGHGVLVATDKMYAQTTATTNMAGPVGGLEVPFKMLYRFKGVSIEEYVGIVQSQQ